MRILVVEDDVGLARAIQAALRRASYEVECLPRTSQALRRLEEERFDLVLFDLGVSGDGLEVLKAARRRTEGRPSVLVLSAGGADALRVLAMKGGADDYLVKPFALDELELRVRAVLRRRSADASRSFVFGELVFDPERRTIAFRQSKQALSTRESSVLEVLANDFGVLVARERLMAEVFGDERDVNPNTLEVFIHRLRKKLVGSGVALRTAHGQGYVLEFGPGG